MSFNRTVEQRFAVSAESTRPAAYPLRAFGARVRAFGKSLRYAGSGLRYVWRTQPNAKVHGVASTSVFFAALILELPVLHCAALALAVTLVWAAEAFNTAVEATVDLVTSEVRPLAKVAKDCAAAAVLATAVGALVIGGLVLGPPLWSRLLAAVAVP